MTFSPVQYMRWAKTAGEGCDIRLSVSGLGMPPADWLGPISMQEALAYAEAYGDPPLIDSIARTYGARPEQVVIAQGTSEANFLLCASLLQPGELVAVESPFYEPLVRAPEACGARVVALERPASRHYQPSIEQLRQLLSEGVRLIIVSDLHNPSGVRLDTQWLAEAAELVRQANAYLLVDEVYFDFLFDAPRPSAFQYNSHVFTTASLTKVYGLGPLRCGWILGDPVVLEKAWAVRDSLGVVAAGPAVMASRAAFAILPRLRAWSAWRMATGRAIADAFMARTRHFTWTPPDAGIMGLLNIPASLSGCGLSRFLVEHEKLLVTPGEYFGVPGTIRVCFGQDGGVLEEGFERLERGTAALLARTSAQPEKAC